MTALGDLVQVAIFGLCALIAIAGALGMATTMSMFRSGIFLMASFVGVAGLFILLSADLMALLQIMMYVGGMLVMILFMVLFMHDPGGAMMAAMPEMLSPLERFFSRGLQQAKADAHSDGTMHMETGASDAHDHGTMQMHMADASMPEMKTSMGDEMDMSMVTPIRRLAAWLAVAIGAALVILILARPSWPAADSRPDPHSAEAVGALLMGKYMVGFEGAGFLILIGIFGSVLLARADRHPDRGDRGDRVAQNDAPPGIEPDLLQTGDGGAPKHSQTRDRKGESAPMRGH